MVVPITPIVMYKYAWDDHTLLCGGVTVLVTASTQCGLASTPATM